MEPRAGYHNAVSGWEEAEPLFGMTFSWEGAQEAERFPFPSLRPPPLHSLP